MKVDAGACLDHCGTSWHNIFSFASGTTQIGSSRCNLLHSAHRAKLGETGSQQISFKSEQFGRCAELQTCVFESETRSGSLLRKSLFLSVEVLVFDLLCRTFVPSGPGSVSTIPRGTDRRAATPAGRPSSALKPPSGRGLDDWTTA